MTNISIREMVKCPALFEHEPCDLVPVHDCKTCRYLKERYATQITCKYGEVYP